MNICRPPSAEKRLAALERLECPASGHRLSRGHPRHPHRAPPGQGSGAGPSLRDHDRLHNALLRTSGSSPRGTAAIVFQSAGDRRLRIDAPRNGRGRRARPAARAARRSTTQEDSYGYRWMVLSNPRGRRASKTSRWASTRSPRQSRPPATASGSCCAVFAFADARGAPGVLHLQLQARVPGIRSSPDPDRPGAASWTERELQLKAQMSERMPIEPELSAGSRCGASRSEPAGARAGARPVSGPRR